MYRGNIAYVLESHLSISERTYQPLLILFHLSMLAPLAGFTWARDLEFPLTFPPVRSRRHSILPLNKSVSRSLESLASVSPRFQNCS
jgi:hypothetical protein